MKYLVIGLGIYGANLAVDLTDMGHEVVGVDNNESNVEAVKEYISTAYIIDASDEQALSVLPLKSVDVVIVAIGENFGASVKTVALLKKMGVKRIMARAIDPLHQSILEGLSVERILTPEQWAASQLVKEFELGADVNVLSVSTDSYVMKFSVPKYFVGLKYSELDLGRKFNLSLIVATRNVEDSNLLGMKHEKEIVVDTTLPDETVKDGDSFTCYGKSSDYRSMMKRITSL